jgi:transcriptional regulator PpsR
MEKPVATGPGDPADLSVLSGLAPELAAALVSLTSDIALVIGGDGVIRNVAVSDAGPGPGQSASGWVGRPWIETVTGDTRRKIEMLLKEVDSAGVARRREVNHPSLGGADIPMSYTALRLGLNGPVIAVGRDLRAVAAIQQRFIDAQQEMERDYWKLRRAQASQRLLGQVAHDAVMVVDATTLLPLECNAAAVGLFGPVGARLPGVIEELLTMARSGDRTAEVRTRFPGGGEGSAMMDIAAAPFRARVQGEMVQRLLVRARSVEVPEELAELEAVVITDSNGRVLMASPAFVAMCQGLDEASVARRTLADLLGDPQRQLAAVLAAVRRDGLSHCAKAHIGVSGRAQFVVEVSAALLTDGDQECIGITLRRAEDSPPDSLPLALQRLVERVGQIPLAEILRQATELAERHAIDSAMRHAASDPGVAAALLQIDEAELSQRMQRLGPSE